MFCSTDESIEEYSLKRYIVQTQGEFLFIERWNVVYFTEN